jgi:signal transduction histidine kinase
VRGPVIRHVVSSSASIQDDQSALARSGYVVFLENAVTLVKERAARHGIALQLDLDPQLGEVVGDERKVKQILINLLSKAVKFTLEGGRISLKAGQRDGAVEISVTDTGVGIASEDQAAVFEEFRQVGSDETRKQEGTGLGLWPSRRSSSSSMAARCGCRASSAAARPSRSRSR